MTTLELDRLEEDVAKARERVVADVVRLRSPGAVAEFKADIGHSFSDTAQRTIDGLKSRAAEEGFKDMADQAAESFSRAADLPGSNTPRSGTGV
jgi:hypothetical protein